MLNTLFHRQSPEGLWHVTRAKSGAPARLNVLTILELIAQHDGCDRGLPNVARDVDELITGDQPDETAVDRLARQLEIDEGHVLADGHVEHHVVGRDSGDRIADAGSICNRYTPLGSDRQIHRDLTGNGLRRVALDDGLRDRRGLGRGDRYCHDGGPGTPGEERDDGQASRNLTNHLKSPYLGVRDTPCVTLIY